MIRSHSAWIRAANFHHADRNGCVACAFEAPAGAQPTTNFPTSAAFLWQVDDTPVRERVDIFAHRLYALDGCQISELRLLPFDHL
jgi:hypothetical protein